MPPHKRCQNIFAVQRCLGEFFGSASKTMSSESKRLSKLRSVFLHRWTGRVSLKLALVIAHLLTVTRHVTQPMLNLNNAIHPA